MGMKHRVTAEIEFPGGAYFIPEIQLRWKIESDFDSFKSSPSWYTLAISPDALPPEGGITYLLQKVEREFFDFFKKRGEKLMDMMEEYESKRLKEVRLEMDTHLQNDPRQVRDYERSSSETKKNGPQGEDSKA